MTKISAIVITFNEEKNIEACLRSMSWADEIVVVDSGSNDNTVQIAKQFTDKIIQTENIAYGLKRNLGIDNSGGQWIYWADADEIVSNELSKEILQTVDSWEYDAYLINRKSFFINKFITHCGWFPDYSLRLFRKSTGIKFNSAEVHEDISFKGKTGKLKGLILHYTDRDFEHYTDKLNLYTTLSARELRKKNKKSGILDIIFRPVFTFLKMYFLKLGILDGYTGLVLCILSSFHVFFKYAKNIEASNLH